MNTNDKYAQALDELDAAHRAGKISDGRYEMHKQNLLAEAAKEQRRGGPVKRVVVGLAIGVGVIIGLIILINIFSAIVAFNSAL